MKSITKKHSQKVKKRIPLSQQRIIQTAMKLADKNGIEGLSMRILVKELGVEAMSLYKHVLEDEFERGQDRIVSDNKKEVV